MFDPFETTESQMTTVTGRLTDEAQIRALVENRVKAVHAKDLSAATANIAPKDYVQFGVVNPLQITGAETMRDRARAWFAAYQGPIGFEIRDLDRKSTRLNSSHANISYAVFCLIKKK